MPAFYLKGTNAAEPYDSFAFRCLNLKRTVKTSKGTDPTAFQWIGSLEPNPSGTAWQIKTEAVRLVKAAARTDKTTKKVDVSIEIKIEATTLNDKDETSTTMVADKTLVFPGLVIDKETDPKKLAERMHISSAWFPSVPRSKTEQARCTAVKGCSGVSSLTITALVTEVGSGGDTFGAASKAVSDNSKAVNDAIAQALGGKSSGGTSAAKGK